MTRPHSHGPGRENTPQKTRVLACIERFVVSVLAFTGAMFLMVAYTPLVNILAMPLWRVPPSPTKAQVAVVLSGGRNNDGSLNDEAVARTITAVRLYHQGLVPRLLFTGGPCCGQSASVLMANLATELGVPKEAITLEEQSSRTYDNAINSAALLRQDGLRSVILVTSPLHMLRAQLTFAAAGVSVHPVLTSTRDLRFSSSPSQRITLLHEALHEYFGLAVYRMRGWI